MINTKNEVILRPKAEERPFIEATNLVWGRNEYIDYTVMIKFSRPMDQDSINWETISIKGTVNNRVTTYDDKSFDISRLADNGTVLTLTPIGGLIPFSAVEITLRRITENNQIGVRSSEGIPLTKDIVLRYNCGHSINPNKPKFAGSAKLATKNGDTWTVWDGDTVTYNDTITAQAVPDSRMVYIVFLPHADNRPITGVRITETTIRRPGQSIDLPEGQEIQFAPENININNTNIDETLASYFYGQVNAMAVPYRLRSSNFSKEQVFGGVRLKVELYDGFSFSDDALDGSQNLKTKFAVLASGMDFIPITGAETKSTNTSGNNQLIINDITIYHSTTRHPLPFAFNNVLDSKMREIKIDNYSLGVTPVTEGLWRFVRDWALDNDYSNIREGSTRGDHFPVTNVSWRDAIVWCNAFSEMSGLTPVYTRSGAFLIRDVNDVLISGAGIRIEQTNGFRLPFEMEWDYAARGGDAITKTLDDKPWFYNYSGRDTWEQVANFSGTIEHVGQRDANTLGFYDMSGNVDEWVWDASGAIALSHPISGSTMGIANRIFRGGNYLQTTAPHIGNSRNNAALDTTADTRGFRIARNGW